MIGSKTYRGRTLNALDVSCLRDTIDQLPQSVAALRGTFLNPQIKPALYLCLSLLKWSFSLREVLMQVPEAFTEDLMVGEMVPHELK